MDYSNAISDLQHNVKSCPCFPSNPKAIWWMYLARNNFLTSHSRFYIPLHCPPFNNIKGLRENSCDESGFT